MKNRICVYTCITGNYDNLKDINQEDGIDYYCFTNNPNIKSNTWKIVIIENNGLDNIRLARKIKILGHPMINNNYDLFLWIDGAIDIIGSVHDFISESNISNYDIVAFSHSKRNNVYDEAVMCVYYRKDSINTINDEMKYIYNKGFKDDNGLIESTVFLKRNNQIVKETMKLWFELIVRFSSRDQLGFNYSIYKSKAKVHWINKNVFLNEWFRWENHLKNIPFKNARIYFNEFTSLESSNFLDIDLINNENVFTLNFSILEDCSKLIIHLGQSPLTKFRIINFKGFKLDNLKVCNLNEIGDYYILDNEMLILYINGNFNIGNSITIQFVLKKMSDNDLLDAFRQVNFDKEYDKNIFSSMVAENERKQTYIENLENEINIYYNSNIIKSIFHLIKKRINKRK